MANEIITHSDVLRHTAGRSAVSVGLTIVLTLALCLLQFGPDPEAFVRAGFVTKSSIMISMIISGLLTAGLSYRSALVMRELMRTRAELQRISGTDQLTGLLNRRGFDEAAMSALTKAGAANLPTTVLMCDIDTSRRSTTSSGTNSETRCWSRSPRCCAPSASEGRCWWQGMAARGIIRPDERGI